MTDDKTKVLTDEEKETMAKEWESYVRDELNSLLDIYLPNSIAGNIGVKYARPIKESYEDGTIVKEEGKAIGVNISINFKFGNAVDVPKEGE